MKGLIYFNFIKYYLPNFPTQCSDDAPQPVKMSSFVLEVCVIICMYMYLTVVPAVKVCVVENFGHKLFILKVDILNGKSRLIVPL